MTTSPNQTYQFGPFRLDAQERLLQRDGVTIALTPKAFDLLLALIERPGRLVEKEELFQAVWPDTIVEESNLSSNIALIRKALSDGENGIRFIETVPKRGYRFVVEVREVTPARADEKLPSASTIHALPPAPRARRFVASLAVIVILAAGIGGWFLFRRTANLPPMTSTPFTSFQGNEMQPSFSPDGNQIAFVWDGEQQNNQDLYLKQYCEHFLARNEMKWAVRQLEGVYQNAFFSRTTRDRSHGHLKTTAGARQAPAAICRRVNRDHPGVARARQLPEPGALRGIL